MIKNINNLILSFLSISWMILIYILDNTDKEELFYGLTLKYKYFFEIVVIIFIILQICLTYIEIKIIQLEKFQIYSKDKLYDVKEIENLDWEFLSVYLGYFFVALGLWILKISITVFTLILIFVSLTRVQYYNPVLLFFKYHFYNVRTERGTKIFLISRKEIRTNELINFERLRRINNFVYFDEEKRW